MKVQPVLSSNIRSFVNLYLYKYKVIIKPRDLIFLSSYKGSALRGLFGHALKKVICVTKSENCKECKYKFNCVYSYVFETPTPKDDPNHKRYSTAPHPYIITPPLEDKDFFSCDELISFDVTLIGKANEYLPYIIYAFMEMGKTGLGAGKGKFKLISVVAYGKNGVLEEVFRNHNGVLKPVDNRIDFKTIKLNCSSPAPVTLTFDTPVRIKELNDLSTEIHFKLLIDRLCERVSLLSKYHCGGRLISVPWINFPILPKLLFYYNRDGSLATGNETCDRIDQATIKIRENKLDWYDWERYSSRQNSRMKLGGLIGSITYEGEITEYLPLLKLGEYVHVGKAATFGLGKYRVRVHDGRSL